MPAATGTAVSSTTQQFIEIYDITNDLVIMKDGATSMIITVDAMNFGLLAEEEQDAVMYAYAGLLNSLTYPIQIVIRSQTKDATNYLNLLREQEMRATSNTKRQFIQQYREFVGDLIRERNVLDKKFYIVVTATSLEMGLLPPQTVVPGVKQIDISTVERSVILEKSRTILEPRRDHLIGQFGRIGLYARQLQTQEIIQLFYNSYNPEASEGQQITDTRDYVTPLVTAQPIATAPPAPAPQPVPVAATPPPEVYQEPPAVTVVPTGEPTPVETPVYAPEIPALNQAPVAPVQEQSVQGVQAPATSDPSQIAPVAPAAAPTV